MQNKAVPTSSAGAGKSDAEREDIVAAQKAALSSMKEDTSDLGMVRSRIAVLEQRINRLDFEHDSLGALQQLRDSVPSLLKVHQTISDMQKKAQSAFAKAEEGGKKLDELKAGLKSFYQETNGLVASEIEERAQHQAGRSQDIKKISDKLFDLEGRVERESEQSQKLQLSEVQKLHADFSAHMDELKDQVLLQVYQREQNILGEVDRCRAEALAARDRNAERRPRDARGSVQQHDRMANLIREEVEKGLQGSFGDLVNGSPAGESRKGGKSLAAVRKESEQAQASLEGEVDTVSQQLEAYIKNYLALLEARGMEPKEAKKVAELGQEALDTLETTKKQVEALRTELGSAAEKRAVELERLGGETEEKKTFERKAKEDDGMIERRLILLQAKIELNMRRIISY